MNTPRRMRLRAMMSLLLAGSLIAGACGSSSDGEAADTTEGAMEETTTTEGAMEETTTTEGAMEEETDGPFGPACEAIPTDGEGSIEGMADDPAATAASNNPLLTTLVAGVTEADLVDTLNSDGPFTIFAPTDDAFAALPEGALDAVLADKDLLTAVLTYHVLPGQMSAADLAGTTAASVAGGELTFGDDGTTVTADGGDVNVICSDVPTANATVHIVENVLLPQAALDALGA